MHSCQCFPSGASHDTRYCLKRAPTYMDSTRTHTRNAHQVSRPSSLRTTQTTSIYAFLAPAAAAPPTAATSSPKRTPPDVRTRTQFQSSPYTCGAVYGCTGRSTSSARTCASSKRSCLHSTCRRGQMWPERTKRVGLLQPKCAPRLG